MSVYIQISIYGYMFPHTYVIHTFINININLPAAAARAAIEASVGASKDSP
jgi:hypothetical protein